jgi:5-formyltetrahydrofolate cyclo-ligase
MPLTRPSRRSWFILLSNAKSPLREQFRAIRREIPLVYRRQAAQAAAELFIQQDIFKQSQHIACYFCFGDEFDAMPIMEAIWQAEKHCYLPVLTEENSLYFVEYKKGDALSPNRYSIQEPVSDDEFPAENLDIVLAPLLAFDMQGHRLGTGGGYYDRTFSFKRENARHHPLIIGLGYEAQQDDALPHDEWDIVLDAVLTEKDFLLTR